MHEVKWVMLCPMARTGSSHTSEFLDSLPGVRSHHGLFNNGPFGRWPFETPTSKDQYNYYSSILDENYERIGGQEHSGEYLDRYIFTDDERYKRPGWKCIGFKVQYAHFVHMPDLRQYLIDNVDIRIILNDRRDLLEHVCAENWCQNGNSRALRPGEQYEFGKTEAIRIEPEEMAVTFRNLCRYREDVIRTFATDGRQFMEWCLEDMFDIDGQLNIESHMALLEFLDIPPETSFTSTFCQTPRPKASDYLTNFQELNSYFTGYHNGLYEKYFGDDWDPRTDFSWPELVEYNLEAVMRTKDNIAFRSDSSLEN